jgi:hypothetical protein
LGSGYLGFVASSEPNSVLKMGGRMWWLSLIELKPSSGSGGWVDQKGALVFCMNGCRSR